MRSLCPCTTTNAAPAVTFSRPSYAPARRLNARLAIAKAALAALGEDAGEEVDILRQRLRAESQTAAAAQETLDRSNTPSTALRAKILAVRRECLLALRSDGVIGDDAFHRLEEELDFADLALARN